MLTRAKQAGDTLIEVLFAVTVFSLVVVGSFSIMNQGTNAVQHSLEITLVRQQIDAQAESLRFLHDSYVTAYQHNGSYTGPAAEWAKMLTSITLTNATSATSFTSIGTTCPSPPIGSFIINSTSASFLVSNAAVSLSPASGFAQVDYSTVPVSARGIWIEAIRSPVSADLTQANSGYIDFHVLACWPVAGSEVPATIGTIVRLYDPRG
jgi:Tfp pilus assembly protein PilV